MEDVYSQVEFPFTINVPPRMLHQNLYRDLEKAVKRRLEGNCIPKIGYIKPSTVQIVKKQLGKAEGSHLTGNITYHVQVRCSAAHPVEGQIIPCMVIGKNDIGILAANYQLPAFTMFIMRTPDDTSDALDRIQKNSYIEVKVLVYALKAANNAEKTKPEYWIVCALSNAKAAEMRYHVLPPVSGKPALMINHANYDIATINSKREELSHGMYLTLEDTKSSIQHIRKNYIAMISTNPLLVEQDIFIQSLIGRSKGVYVIGKITNIEQDEDVCIHTVEVIISSRHNIETKQEMEIEVPKPKPQFTDSTSRGDIEIYLDYKDGQSLTHCKLDIWGRHVKYIVNKTEMVHPNRQYINQLTNIIYSKKGDIVQEKTGRQQHFKEKKSGKPVATLINKDKHVINRAYYKMMELLNFFGAEVFPLRSMKIGCVAECPGGFIQALLDHRVYNPEGEYLETGIKDDINCISIGINCPAWKDFEGKVRKSYKYVNLRCDEDLDPSLDPTKTNLMLIGGTKQMNLPSGNILLRSSRDRYYQEFSDERGGKADLVTGDAGIERNKADTTEEMDTHKLLLAEIIIALSIQKAGGCFVLKIYDMATEFTVNLLEVVSFCYEEIGLFKPDTSRAASSEKYLVCKNFNITEDLREELLIALESIIDQEVADGSYYANMITVSHSKMLEAVTNYNSYYMKQQVSFIEAGRSYAQLYNNAISSSNRDQMVYEMLAKVGIQTSTAQDFYQTINMAW
jgi:23S rRNA U2552 (ribose-2'-O)-methylase RlmE/FtsJ